MKKMIQLMVGTLLSVSAPAQVQNLDFEKWEFPLNNNFASNIPTGWVWTNSTFIDRTRNFYYPPSSNAHKNNHSIKLGIWYNYDKDAAIQHTSINSKPLSLKGYYTYTDNIILGDNGRQNDTAMISVYLTKHNHQTHQTDTIGQGFFETGKETQTYTAFTANIVYINTQIPDSIIIVLDPSLCRRGGRTNQSENSLSSFFTVDNLSLNNTLTGVESITPFSTFVVSPNPATDIIQLEPDFSEIAIRDITGKLIEQQTPESGKVNIQHLPPGTYFMETLDKAQLMRAKFIKQ